MSPSPLFFGHREHAVGDGAPASAGSGGGIRAAGIRDVDLELASPVTQLDDQRDCLADGNATERKSSIRARVGRNQWATRRVGSANVAGGSGREWFEARIARVVRDVHEYVVKRVDCARIRDDARQRRRRRDAAFGRRADWDERADALTSTFPRRSAASAGLGPRARVAAVERPPAAVARGSARDALGGAISGLAHRCSAKPRLASASASIGRHARSAVEDVPAAVPGHAAEDPLLRAGLSWACRIRNSRGADVGRVTNSARCARIAHTALQKTAASIGDGSAIGPHVGTRLGHAHAAVESQGHAERADVGCHGTANAAVALAARDRPSAPRVGHDAAVRLEFVASSRTGHPAVHRADHNVKASAVVTRACRHVVAAAGERRVQAVAAHGGVRA